MIIVWSRIKEGGFVLLTRYWVRVWAKFEEKVKVLLFISDLLQKTQDPCLFFSSHSEWHLDPISYSTHHDLALNYNSFWIFKQSELKLCFLSLLRPSSWKTCSAREAFSCVGYFSPTPTFSLIFTLPLVNIHSLSFCAKKNNMVFMNKKCEIQIDQIFHLFQLWKTHNIPKGNVMKQAQGGERVPKVRFRSLGIN